MSSQSDSSNNRRRFIGSAASIGGLAYLGVIDNFAKNFTLGLVQKAIAQSKSSVDVKNYVGVRMPGAPPRWIFDGLLRYNTNDPTLRPNPGVATRYIVQNGIAVDTEYFVSPFQTADGRTILLPPLWRTLVRNGRGGTVSLENLAAKMLTIRGYGNIADGHQENGALQTHPNLSMGSINGYMADISTHPFSVLQSHYRDNKGYRSKTGKDPIRLTDQNMIATLLSPFSNSNATNQARGLASNMETAMDRALAILTGVKNSQLPGVGAIRESNQSVKSTIKNGVATILAEWQPTFNKYMNIIRETVNYRTIYPAGIPGLTDFPIVPNMTSLRFTESNKGFAVGTDIRDALATLVINSRVAAGFALAEISLRNNLTSVVDINVDNESMVYTGSFSFNKAGSAAMAVPTFTRQTGYNIDEHGTGCMVSLAFSSMFFRAIGASILELLTTLESTRDSDGVTLDKRTYVHLHSEFNRRPRNDGRTNGIAAGAIEDGRFGTGSDHGQQNMVSSVFSGSITSPFCVGNIRLDSSNGSNIYTGTHGLKSNYVYTDGSQQEGSPIHLASTLANLLGLPKNPWINLANPLVTIGANGQLVPMVRTQIV